MSRAYYTSILGLRPEANEAEVKSAFRRLVKKYHPDINPSPKAQERFIELKKAYDYLLEYPYSPGQTTQRSTIPPAQRREEEEKKKREVRMRRAREIRKQKEEAERKAWEKFKNSPAMWGIIFIVLTFYFAVSGVCLITISEYPYEGSNVKEPEFAVVICTLIIFGFTLLLYRFYQFLRK
jgi:hypothetical protein